MRSSITWCPRRNALELRADDRYLLRAPTYQQGDVPPYMQDYNHGFSLITDPGRGDQWLLQEKGERIFHEASLPCTDEPAIAQRLEKIALMRLRYQGRGTIRANMKAFRAVATDTIRLFYPRWGAEWTPMTLEVLKKRFIVDKSDGEPRLGVELEVAETSPYIYDCSIAEELTPAGYRQVSTPASL
jgi:hypothetical protein